MSDTCPKCGWVVDYGCGCPNGRPAFPLVEYHGEIAIKARLVTASNPGDAEAQEGENG